MTSPEPKGWFARFLRWADGDGEEERSPFDPLPEKAEFMEYLDYLNSHESIGYNAFHRMHLLSEEAREQLEAASREGTLPRRRRHGRLRREVWLYRLLSAAVVAVLLWTLLLVAVDLPGFGRGDAPAVNEVAQRYLERGLEETGAVNAVAGMILDYRAFDTFGESTVLFAATMSVILLLRSPGRKRDFAPPSDNRIFTQVGRVLLPFLLLYGVYVVLNGHLSPGGGFSGGTVLGCALILGALVLGEERMHRLLPPERITRMSVLCLLLYGLMKGYSFFTGANHVGWEVPKGIPGAILSSGFILPLNICVGIIVAGTMYTFYTLFAEKEG